MTGPLDPVMFTMNVLVGPAALSARIGAWMWKLVAPAAIDPGPDTPS